MKVRDIMSTDLAKATLDNTLTEIAELMKEEDVGAIPVVQSGKLRGLLTDRDVVIRCIAAGKDPSATTAEEILTEEVETVGPDTDVEAAADLMGARQIRRLPVVEDDELLGMLSLGDVSVKHEKKEVVARTLEEVSPGAKDASAPSGHKQVEQGKTPGEPTSAPKNSQRVPNKKQGLKRSTRRKSA